MQCEWFRMKFERFTTTAGEGKEEKEISPSEFLLPLRQRAAELVKAGRLDEAGRLLSGIQRTLRLNDKKGGTHDKLYQRDRIQPGS